MANELVIKEPDTKEVEAQGAALLDRAAALVVNDDASAQVAADIILDAKKCQKAVEWLYAESIGLAHKLHKQLCGKSKLLSDPPVMAETMAKRKLGFHLQEVEKKRKDEAERLRKEAEEKAKAEQIAKAEKQMDSGDLDACKRTLEAPIAPVVAAPVTPEPAKMAGISYRDEVKYEITDANAVPRDLCSPDEKKIRNRVRDQGASASIPGVRVYVEKVLLGRAA